ncbi:glycine N-acyltransferase-like protein 3 [Haliotis rubra]|uniref:glycine N-acyltransferase-like protein 3 n=1 Tax=Haliotis rubra TaxID=36100 RepID=UPI001EE548D3|nr:glycine N-acyltransferase-like protein 3 [Haliotis rubra]
MAVKLVETQLTQMLEVLKTSHRWIKIMGEVEAALEHRITDYEFVVDRWPDCRAMVVRAKDNDLQLKYLEPLVNLYATDDEALRGLLHNLDWSKGIRFECVERRLVPVLSEVIQLYRVPTFLHTDCTLMRVTHDTLKLRPIPEGCTMSSLTADQASQVNSRWVLRNGDVSEAYIKHLITTLPSTCLYNREGALLGYALTYHYGCLGVLYVLEEHRGNGYGKVAMSQLALKHLQKERGVCHDTTCQCSVYQDA